LFLSFVNRLEIFSSLDEAGSDEVIDKMWDAKRSAGSVPGKEQQKRSATGEEAGQVETADGTRPRDRPGRIMRGEERGSDWRY
jgi:hypothetical protein